MKRTLFAIAVVMLFAVACATTPATPSLRGTLTAVEGHALTVTPTDGGQPVNVEISWGTEVFWANGVKATGHSVLTPGQPVQIFTKGDTVTKVVIAQ